MEETKNNPYVFYCGTEEHAQKLERLHDEYFRLREKVLAPSFIPAVGTPNYGIINVLRRARELSGRPVVGVFGKPCIMKHIEMAQIIERYCGGNNFQHLCPPVLKTLEIDKVNDMIATLNHQETAFEKVRRLEEIDKASQMVKHRLKCEKNRRKRKKRNV